MAKKPRRHLHVVPDVPDPEPQPPPDFDCTCSLGGPFEELCPIHFDEE